MQIKVGFGSVNMKGTYEPYGDVHDELMSQVMVVNDGRERAAWLMGDWYNWTAPAALMLRRVIAEHTGFPFERIFICSSENHNSAHMPSKIDTEQAKVLGTRMAESVKLAMEDARPALMALAVADVGRRYSACRRKKINDELGVFSFWGGFTVEGKMLNITRAVRGQVAVLCSDNPGPAYGGVKDFPQTIRDYDASELHGEIYFDRPVDNLVHLLSFRDEHDETIGTIIRFSAHVQGGHDYEHEEYVETAGYPGWARRYIERKLGGIGAFILGCQGDLLPLFDVGGCEKVKAMGEGIATAAFEALQTQGDEAFKPLERLAIATVTARMPLRKTTPPNFQEAEEAVKRAETELVAAVRDRAPVGTIKKLAEYKTWCEWVIRFFFNRYGMTEEQAKSKVWPVDVSAMALNDVVLAGMVAEPSVQTSLRLRQQFGDRILTISECNGDIGYMVPEDDIHDGGYEATLSIISEKGEETLRNAVAEAIRKVL